METLPSSFLTPGPPSLPSFPPASAVASEAPALGGASGSAMGSRASTLLRDEELEEIKKETGCESGPGGGNASGRLWED